jgi:transcriptional regulator with XRE-family HTH domain
MTSRSDATVSPTLSADAIDDALAAFSARVAQLRHQSGMTQEQLAARAGLEQSNLSKLERGDHRPLIDTVLRLQHALGLRSIEELFGDVPEPNAPTARLLGL